MEHKPLKITRCWAREQDHVSLSDCLLFVKRGIVFNAVFDFDD